MLALLLMAGIASILYGSLASRRRAGTAARRRPSRSSDMRAALTYLRAQLSEQYPQRMWKAAELPLLFAGRAERAALCGGAAGARRGRRRLLLPARRRRATERSRSSCRSASFPIPRRCKQPEFRDAERSVLADGIAELKIGYFGRDANAADARRADVARSLGRPAAPAAPRAPRREARQGRRRGRRSSSSRGDRRRRAVRSGTSGQSRCMRGAGR